MRNNIVTAVYAGGCYTRTEALVQYDYGQILHLSGFGLPAAFQVDFGTSRTQGETVQVIGALDNVSVPDTLLQGSANIYAFIRLHTGEDDGETVYVIEIPVVARPEITGEAPTPEEQGLIDQLMAALAAGVAAAEGAAAQIEGMSAEAETLPAGSSATAAWDAEQGKLLLGIPRGNTGATGPEGPEGQDGPAGADGFSPTVTVEEISGGHRVTITDAEGDHVFDVMDGQGGGGGTSDYEDLSNKPQIAGTTLSGNKSLADLGIAAASDIPAVPVQSVNSKTGAVVLGASDVGALPDDTTIPTKTSQLQNDSGFLTSAPVTSVNSKTGAVTLTASDVGAGTYSKPSGGIPKTDLASAVQTSLGKADTALQSAPVSSVNGQTGAVTLSIPSSASDVGAVAVAQGVAHAGEFCVVGSDGNITTVTMTAWAGGSY